MMWMQSKTMRISKMVVKIKPMHTDHACFIIPGQLDFKIEPGIHTKFVIELIICIHNVTISV